MVMQDKRWLGEAVINVLDNAINYSPCGSKIFIRLQKRNDFVRMEIEDQGIGMQNNFLSQLADFNYLNIGGMSFWTPHVILISAGIELFLSLIHI